MTFTGIAESIIGSLIVMVIWALIAFIVLRIIRRLKEENEKYQTLFSQIKKAIAGSEEQAVLNNLYFLMNLLLNRFQRRLDELYRKRNITVVVYLILLYCGLTNQNPYDGAFIFIFYGAMIGYQIYSIHKFNNRIEIFELTIVEAVCENSFAPVNSVGEKSCPNE